MEWTFKVPGTPVPQPRQRISARNGFARAYTPSGHPIHAYRQAVALLGKAAQVPPSVGWCELKVEAVFVRPKSHFRKSGLTDKAPEYPGHSCGDCDNIAKGVADSLFSEDTHVVRWVLSKRYAAAGELAHTVIAVREL
jgi:Holliday junction resolvase RusA-like endonuclease